MSAISREIRILALNLICINGMLASTAALAAESLEQAWDSALKRNYQIIASQQKEQAAAQQTALANSNYLPKISLDAGHLKLQSEPSAKLAIPSLPFLGSLSLPFAQDNSSFAAVSLTAPLFTAGRISHGVAAAEALQDASQAHTSSTRSEQKLAIAQAYLNVLRAEHAVQVAASYQQAVEKHVSDVRQLLQQGYVARHDLLASETAESGAQLQSLRAANALELARADYNRWLGRPYSETVQLQDLPEPDSTAGTPGKPRDAGSLPELQQMAQQQRPELRELGQQTLALSRQADSVRASQLPQLALNAGYGKLENRYLAEDKGWWVGVVMKWDLFDGGLARHQASQLAANASALTELQSDARERISLQVRQSWLNCQEAQARLLLTQKARVQAAETLRLAQERYRAAMGPNSDVLDAETRHQQAEADYHNARYDQKLAELQLQYAAGQL